MNNWFYMRHPRRLVLPKEGQWVLLAIPGVGDWAFEARQWAEGYWDEPGLVATHWMPMPEPPEIPSEAQLVAFAHGQMGDIRIEE